MKTEFSFYDEDGSLKKASLVMAFEYNNNQYVVYDLKDEESIEKDIIHVREYKLIDNVAHLYKINNKDFRAIKKIINDQIKSIESE